MVASSQGGLKGEVDSQVDAFRHGSRSVSAPPRYELYCLWAIAGDKRKLAVYEDPAHRWIHGVTP